MIEQLSREILNDYIEQLIAVDNDIVDQKGNIYSTEHWTKENFIKDCPGKWKYSLLDTEQDTVQGCIITTEYMKQRLHINRFFVATTAVRKGVASRMIACLFDYALKTQIIEINLFVNIRNKEAIAFYEKKHFIRAQGKILEEMLFQLHRTSYNDEFFVDQLGNHYFAYFCPMERIKNGER